MISIIIPVFNVEAYVRKCLDSVVNQTYKDLEILVIDDGSTDGSGKICDEYKKDDRVSVFHTENHGLSAARNFGLDNANGEWIGFVDSDDWIEPDMYEVLLNRAEETGADIVECGYYYEYPKKTEERKKIDCLISGKEAVGELLQKKLSDVVWDKLWRKECFEKIRFPENRVFEEYATTYRVFLETNTICDLPVSKYHYFQREGSLSKTHEMDNLVCYWLSHRERYEELYDRVDEVSQKKLLRNCASAAGRVWAYYCDCNKEEQIKYHNFVIDMNVFVNEHVSLFGDPIWSIRERVGSFFPHFMNEYSFRSAWVLNKISRIV